MKILLVGLLIILFWVTIFLISLKHPTTNVKIIPNISELECFEMNCSYQPRSSNESICVCLIE